MEKSNDRLYSAEIKAVRESKYSIVELLARIGVKDVSLKARGNLWDKYFNIIQDFLAYLCLSLKL